MVEKHCTEKDSRRGTEKIGVHRQIGERARMLVRERDAEGREHKREHLHNMEQRTSKMLLCLGMCLALLMCCPNFVLFVLCARICVYVCTLTPRCADEKEAFEHEWQQRAPAAAAAAPHRYLLDDDAAATTTTTTSGGDRGARLMLQHADTQQRHHPSHHQHQQQQHAGRRESGRVVVEEPADDTDRYTARHTQHRRGTAAADGNDPCRWR